MATASTAVTAIRDLIRTAALTERERGSCYVRLGKLSDREVAEDLFPKLAQVYEDKEGAAKAVRAALLQQRGTP